MNDFTKEELIDLKIIISIWCLKYIDNKQARKLSDKLQFMIENYPSSAPNKCDHGINYRNCFKCFEANNE